MQREDREAEPDEAPSHVVDPLIRAHIYSLCTALGGSSVEETGAYVLGDDALACLKDLRRWLKLYDEKLNRYDVARCLSEMKLVQNDLLRIIGMWKESEAMAKTNHRIVVACIELLTPLTWPLEKYNDQMTVNHHRHIPVLQFAHASYKSAILQHKSGKILKDIIRAGLPAMAMPPIERATRDEGIIKLILYTLRNIAIIEHPMPTESGTGEEINRSATINAFAEQNVFHLLLTVSSGIADDFRAQDDVVMEAIYHLIKGIDAEALFRIDVEEAEKLGKDLSMLLKMEDDMKRSRTAPTRHNRFGTTLWVERNDGTRSFVSGQDALFGKATGLEKLDKSKKYKKPRGFDSKGISQKTDFDLVVRLDASAKKHLQKFVQDFIDAGFNPLFLAIRKAIDRDVERLLDSHSRQYFYLVAWFLAAEGARRRAAAKDRKKRGITSVEEDSFGVVAAVLNHEFLATLQRKMVGWYDMKQWTELQAGMRCFTQILYTVQDMMLSPIEEDQEIAENIQNRLFYEETTMDLVYNICRSYTKQPFGWLNDCTEMAHVHLKLLEKYSQQHEHMFVRSRRRRQSRKRAQKAVESGDVEADELQDENEEQMVAASRRAAAERAFDFNRFEAKYLNQNCITTFISFLRYYRELDVNQIMRVIKMLHRIFEKRKEEVLLYRMDLVDLLYQMVEGSKALPMRHPAYKQVDQFAKYFLRKLFKKLEAEPAMYVELLFTKINSSLYYLQNGYDKELHIPRTRPAAELHIKSSEGLGYGDQIGVVVAALLDDNKSSHVEWLKDILKVAASERKMWEDEATARALLETEDRDRSASPRPDPPAVALPPDIFINPITDERKTAMFKDGTLRLLLTLIGAQKLDLINETRDTKWIFPAALPLQTLSDNLTLLQNAANDPPSFDGDAVAADLIRRKLLPRKRDALSSDEEAGPDDDLMFEPGGPTNIHGLKKRAPGTRRNKRVKATGEVETEEKRKKKDAPPIRSSKFVTISDDESDEEATKAFFEREKALREMTGRLAENRTTEPTHHDS